MDAEEEGGSSCHSCKRDKKDHSGRMLLDVSHCQGLEYPHHFIGISVSTIDQSLESSLILRGRKWVSRCF
jgi:hypothetical protein